MEVNVTKRIETQTGSRYCPVVVNGSGRIRSDWVIIVDACYPSRKVDRPHHRY